MVDTDDLIRDYRAGLSTTELAEKYPLSSSAIQARLSRADVDMRPPGGQRLELPTEEIVDRYRSGESINELADAFDVSRTPIYRRLREADVEIRGQSAAEKVKWEQMSEEDRKRQVAAAHEATRGSSKSWETLCRIAQTREERQSHVSESERRLQSLLHERGIEDITLQKAVGPYNCDLAIPPVAVEVFGGHWHWTGDHLRRTEKRFRHLMDRGWSVYVVPVTDSFPLTGAVADHLVAYINRARRAEAVACEYRVVWGAGEHVTTGGPEDDEISIEPPFTRGRDPSTGRYTDVPR